MRREEPWNATRVSPNALAGTHRAQQLGYFMTVTPVLVLNVSH
jgi:hypothetical protein